MVDRSIAITPTFANLMTRATILEKKGDAAGAKDQRAKALAMANERDLNLYGYRLVAEKKLDEAITIFQRNAEAHPDSWNVHDSLGEALAQKGDKKAAVASYKRALSLAKDPAQQKRIEGVLATLQPK
jgi:tetratricopeptide (TPR) repeat protein